MKKLGAISSIVSSVMLSINLLGRDRAAQDESRRFWALLQQAREEAELQGIERRQRRLFDVGWSGLRLVHRGVLINESTSRRTGRRAMV